MTKFLEERPTVSPRGDGFTPPTNHDEAVSTETTTVVQFPNSDSTSTTQDSSKDIPEFPLDLNIDKQGKLVRLEKQIQSEILALCNEQGVTLEVFLESVWVCLKNHPKLTDKVITEAQQRRELRKELGNLKRFETGQRKTRQKLAKLGHR